MHGGYQLSDEGARLNSLRHIVYINVFRRVYMASLVAPPIIRKTCQ